MDASPESHLRRVLTPGFVVPAATLWLYFVAIVYLNSYLEYFSARRHWFDPSLLRLLSFSYPALIFATVIATSYWLLLYRSGDLSRRAWWSIYAVYVVILVATVLFDGLAQLSFDISRTNSSILFAALAALTTIGVPLFIRLRSGRDPRGEDTLLRIERLWAKVHEYTRASALAASTPELEAEAAEARQELDTILADAKAELLTWRYRFSSLIAFVICSLFFLCLVGSLGRCVAAADAFWEHRQRSFLADTPERQVSLLFSDGRAALIQERSSKNDRVIQFIGNVSDLRLLLRSPTQAFLEETGIVLDELRTKITRYRVEQLASNITAYCAEKGVPPTSLGDIQSWQSSRGEVHGGDVLLDGWKQELTFEIISRDPIEFIVQSSGADGISGSADDVIQQVSE